MRSVLNGYVDELFSSLLHFDINGPEAHLKDEKLYLTWELPGLSKEDTSVFFEDMILNVFALGGRHQGQISKLRITNDYDVSATEVTIKDGILKIIIPKQKTKSNKVQIAIK